MVRLFLQRLVSQRLLSQRPLLQLLVAITLISSSTSWAAASNDARWYQVELFIFSQNQDNLKAESWDDKLLPLQHSKAISLYGERARKAGLVLLDSSSRALPIAKSLMKRRGYQPLFHQVWQQPLLAKKQAFPIKIRGGEQLNDHTFELDGDITLDIARYLHLRTNLFYTLKKPADWQGYLAPEEISEETAVAGTVSELLPIPLDTEAQTAAIELPFISKDPTLLTVQMKQGRRMRGDQLHYLDHPMFGLFIKLTRIKGPTSAHERTPATSEIAATVIPPTAQIISSTAENIQPEPVAATPVPLNFNPAALSPTGTQ
ncbi:MAG: CsiV family protein [Motiliproteus sp.]